MKPLPGQLKQLLPRLAFAVGLAVLAVVLVNRAMTRQRLQYEAEKQEILASLPRPIAVIVAARDLPAGAPIEQSDLAAAQIPETFVQPYAARAPQEVVGQVTLAPLAAGEQILTNKIHPPNAGPMGGTLSSVTPKGKRAVTIVVDTITGVGGFVRPGDAVDILWTIKLPQDEQVVTMTLFQDVPVLAIGGDTVARQQQAPAKGGGQPQGSAEPSQFMATLALTPQETSFLLFAREQGRIQLSLRPRTEEGQVVVVPANINSLMQSQLGAPSSGPQQQAAEAPKPPRQVEIYRGLKRDVIALQDDASRPAATP